MKLIAEYANKLRLCWNILRATPGNMYAHAVRELPPAGDDDMQALMNRGLLDLVLVFSTQRHSGFSASYATAALEKLLRFQPLGPLTGEDHEWIEVGDGVFQNNRCSRVFKQNGQAYDIDGKVFTDETGSYTNSNSCVPVEFPYTPRTEYVDLTAEPTP